MSGRDLYTFFKPVLILLIFLLKIIPRFILNFLWSVTSPFEGNVALTIRYLIVASKAKSCKGQGFIGRNVTIKNLQNLTLGKNFSIHANCYIDAAGEVIIGDNVSIAHNTSIISFEHQWGVTSLPIKYNPTKLSKISICDDIWIGCGVRILAGTSIQSRVIVGAGTVVNGTNLDCNSVYVGIPARKVKDI